MPDQHFFSAAAAPAAHSDVFGPLLGGERSLWQGRCAVAEYAFDEAASLPRWVLPETTEVLVTDHRVVYAYTRSDTPDDVEVTSGELRWLWPQHLRVQPGALTTGRAAAAAQLQLVCAASDGSFPALVFAGGDLGTVQDADRLANTIRHAIAHFRVDNADKLGLTALQARMLSRLLIGPEFSNYQGGEGQTVTLLGAMSVHRPAEPAPLEIGYVAAEEPGDDLAAESLLLASLDEEAPRPAAEPNRWAALEPDLPRPAAEPDRWAAPEPELPRPVPTTYAGARLPGNRPGRAADEARALQAAAAEEATQLNQPDLASRAASLAARVASLVSATEGHDRPTADPIQAAAAAAAARAAAGQAATAERAAAEQAAFEQAAFERAAADRAAAERAAADLARAARAAEQAAADREQLARAQAAQLAAEQARADRAAADQARADRARAEQARAEREWAEQAAAEAATDRETDSSEVPTTDLSSRAAGVRRAAARFAANAAKGKAGTRRIEPEIGSTSRGNRHR